VEVTEHPPHGTLELLGLAAISSQMRDGKRRARGGRARTTLATVSEPVPSPAVAAPVAAVVGAAPSDAVRPGSSRAKCRYAQPKWPSTAALPSGAGATGGMDCRAAVASGARWRASPKGDDIPTLSRL